MAEYVRVPQNQPEMIATDATKCKNIEELGILINGIGIAMTEQFAKENNLEHILVKQPSKLELPNLG